MARSGKSVKSRHHLGASDVLFSLAIVIGFFTLWPLLVIAAFVMFFVWAVKMLTTNRIFLISFVLCAVIVSTGTTLDYTETHRNIIWGLTTLVLLVMLKEIEVNRPVALAFFLYWLFVTYSILLATNFGEAINQSLRVFMMMMYMCVATVILRDNKWFPKVLIALTTGLAIYSFCEIGFTAFSRGLMGNKNHCSVVFVLLGILCLYYYKSWKIPSIVAVLMSLAVILILRHRASLLAIGLCSGVYALTQRKYLVKTLCVMMIFGCITYAVKGKSLFDTESLSQRKEAWSQTLNMIKDNPAGVGAGNWMLIYPSYAMNTPITRAMNYNKKFWGKTHNDYLQVCSEMGVVGIMCYLSIFVLALYYSRGFIRIGIVAYMTIAFFSFPMMRPFPSLLLMIYLAHIKTKTIHINKSFVICASIILYFCVVNTTYRHLTARKIIRIYTARAVNDWDTVLEETDNISFLSNLDSTNGCPIEFYRGLAHFYKDDNENALKSFASAKDAAPNHLYVLMNYAGLSAINGQFQQARNIYAKVDNMYPDFPDRKRQ